MSAGENKVGQVAVSCMQSGGSTEEQASQGFPVNRGPSCCSPGRHQSKNACSRKARDLPPRTVAIRVVGVWLEALGAECTRRALAAERKVVPATLLARAIHDTLSGLAVRTDCGVITYQESVMRICAAASAHAAMRKMVL